MKISILIPLWNEREQLPVTLETLDKYLPEKYSWELFFVDDGSTDGSFEYLKKAREKDPRIRGLAFSRNFGKETALVAGLEHVTGDACIVMDCDLQHPPKHIPEMLKLWEEGYEVVEGVKTDRGEESRPKAFAAKSFYRLFEKLSGLPLENASDFKLLDRKVIDALNACPEPAGFFRGLSAWAGFKRTSFPFEVEERSVGESRWSLARLIELSGDAFFGFSQKPLLLPFVFSGIFLLDAFIRLIVNCFVPRTPVEGLRGLVLCIAGLLFFCQGLLGAYTGRAYKAVQGRPRYLVEEMLDD